FFGVVVLIEEAFAQTLNTAEAVGFVGHAHGFHVRQPGVGHVKQRILARAVHGHFVGAAVAIIHEFNFDFLADALQVTVAPYLEWIGRRGPAAFLGSALVGTAHGMGINTVGLPVHDVDAPAVGLPPGQARGKMLVGVLDAPIMFVFVFVLRGIRRGVTTQPELLNKLVALRVVAQFLESRQLFVGDDPADIFVQPLFVNSAEFFFNCTLVVSLALPLQRIFILTLLRGGRFLLGRLVAGLSGRLDWRCLAGFLRSQYETTKNKDNTSYEKISKPG